VSPRFESRYSLDALVSVVADVARAANPARPESVTQSVYDAARAKAGHKDAPTGKQSAARLGMSWPDALAFALDPERRSTEIALGRRLGSEEAPWIDELAVRSALRTVALRLGKKTLRPAEYRAERERMLAAARRSTRHRLELELPTEGQIERVAGDWERALELAGLAPRVRRENERGVSIVDALELALEAHGALATSHELPIFARANRIALEKIRRPWREYLTELRERRDEWGKWTPSSPPAWRVRPDYRVPVPLPPDLPRIGRREWTREECLDALVLLLAERPGERLTLRGYQEASAGRRDLPSLSALQRQGKFSEMVAEARGLQASSG